MFRSLNVCLVLTKVSQQTFEEIQEEHAVSPTSEFPFIEFFF